MSNAQRLPQGFVVSEIPDIAPSAIGDIRSTTKGILIPRMTEAQKNAIASPATSLLVYQTDENAGFWYYDSTAWVWLGDGNFIPLAGTQTDAPVTGSIELQDGTVLNIFAGDLATDGQTRYFGFTDDGGISMSNKSDNSGVHSDFLLTSTSADINVNNVDTDETVHMTFQIDGTVFEDNTATPKGIQYGADYSATYVDRSLVDKAYVDGVAGDYVPLSGTGVGEPVTGTVEFDNGAGATTDIDATGLTVTNANGHTDVFPNSVTVYNSTGQLTGMDAGFGLQLATNSGGHESYINNDDATNNGQTYKLPNKAAGTYVLATDDDLPDTSTLVPYTGANANVDLGDYEIRAFTYRDYSNDIIIDEGGIVSSKEQFNLVSGADKITWSGAALSGDHTRNPANADGNEVLSVNGNTADSVGEITLPVDSSPTDGSTNPVSSNGVFDALALKANAPSGMFPSAAFNYAITATTLTKAFNVGTSGNGAFNAQTKLYFFDGYISLSGLSASSGSVSFGFLGTATISAIRYTTAATKAALPSGGLAANVTTTSATALTTATTQTSAILRITGQLRVSVAGTVIPAVTGSVNSPSANTDANSWFIFEEIGGNAMTATSDID